MFWIIFLLRTQGLAPTIPLPDAQLWWAVCFPIHDLVYLIPQKELLEAQGNWNQANPETWFSWFLLDKSNIALSFSPGFVLLPNIHYLGIYT